MNAGDIHVLEESRAWMVVNKPAGLPVHATSADEPDLLTLMGRGLHAVHRLDRETSGLVFLAKNPATAADVMSIWGTDAVRKVYRAIAWSPVGGKDAGATFEWNFGLSDRAEGRKDPAGPRPTWKPCRTIVQVISTHGDRSFLEAEIKTGRKHQIRRHAALSGHPLLGDSRYGRDDGFTRVGLHAFSLSLQWRGLPLAWTCEPPPDFMAMLESRARPSS